MLLLFKHFWAAFILATVANGAIWWLRGKPHRERDPGLAEGYRSLIRGFVTWGNLPWLIMGAGVLSGGVPSTFHYFDPRSSNPFVVAWFGSILFLWVVGTYWLFARGGAEQLVRHPGLVQPQFASASVIKAVSVLGVAGGMAGFAVLYRVGFKPPEFP